MRKKFDTVQSFLTLQLVVYIVTTVGSYEFSPLIFCAALIRTKFSRWMNGWMDGLTNESVGGRREVTV